MALADQILELTKKLSKLSSPQIAERVGCHDAYVRSVWHRNGMFRGDHDPQVDYSVQRGKGKFKRLPMDEYLKLVAAAKRNGHDR